jgi:hypothetical protein
MIVTTEVAIRHWGLAQHDQGGRRVEHASERFM